MFYQSKSVHEIIVVIRVLGKRAQHVSYRRKVKLYRTYMPIYGCAL